MARILVVDDSALSRRMSRRILEGAGHQVVEAENGHLGLERYFLGKPDLVLLDITMKGLSGIEVLEQLRQMDEKARVVILTADLQQSTRTTTAALGASGFVIKPVSPDLLLSAVTEALGTGA